MNRPFTGGGDWVLGVVVVVEVVEEEEERGRSEREERREWPVLDSEISTPSSQRQINPHNDWN